MTRGRNRTDEGVLATMRLLLDAGADVNARMVTDSARAGEARCRPRLAQPRPRQPGAEPRRPSRIRPPCTAPQKRGFTPFVKFLAENGADLQAKDANGRTALDLAKGVGVPGVRQAVGEGFPETAALIESLMAAKGTPVSSPR